MIPQQTATARSLNWVLFLIGMLIVALRSDWDWITLLGAWVASIHVTVKFK